MEVQITLVNLKDIPTLQINNHTVRYILILLCLLNILDSWNMLFLLAIQTYCGICLKNVEINRREYEELIRLSSPWISLMNRPWVGRFQYSLHDPFESILCDNTIILFNQV